MKHRDPAPRATCLVTLLLLGVVLSASRSGAAPAEPTLKKALAQPPEWFKSDDGRRLADNVVSWQNPNGGWWKEYDPNTAKPAEPKFDDNGKAAPGDASDVWRQGSTIDNGATISELRVLAAAQHATGDAKYQDAFRRGLKFLFDSQYDNGGWPQRFPLQDNYGRHVTFNDRAMVNVMNLLKDVAEGAEQTKFLGEDDRRRARQSFDRGVDCILKSQIKQDGKLTAWCQQHDAETLAPAKARAYELPSISGSESVDIVLVLMRVDNPDARVRQAIESAMAWFDRAKITGKRYERVTGPQYEGGKDQILVDDPSAPSLWARFYDVETNKPFFSNREGAKLDSLDQVPHERRVGYAWFTTSPAKLEKAYAQWKKRVGDAAQAAK